jgi:prevent-host-death family protein
MTVAVRASQVLRITRDTSDTFAHMADVTIRELRNNGGEIVDRAARGERIVITRSGRPVAELRPLRRALSAEELVDRWRHLPRVDPVKLRADLDELLDWRL